MGMSDHPVRAMGMCGVALAGGGLLGSLVSDMLKSTKGDPVSVLVICFGGLMVALFCAFVLMTLFFPYADYDYPCSLREPRRGERLGSFQSQGKTGVRSSRIPEGYEPPPDDEYGDEPVFPPENPEIEWKDGTYNPAWSVVNPPLIEDPVMTPREAVESDPTMAKIDVDDLLGTIRKAMQIGDAEAVLRFIRERAKQGDDTINLDEVAAPSGDSVRTLVDNYYRKYHEEA